MTEQELQYFSSLVWPHSWDIWVSGALRRHPTYVEDVLERFRNDTKSSD